MWEALHIIHEPHGNQSIISTKHALYDTVASDGMDVVAHLNELCLIWERLTLAGELISENEFKVLVASSLPKSWDFFTQGYLGYHGGMQGNTEAQALTVQQLFSLIHEESKRRKQRDMAEERAYAMAGPSVTHQKKHRCAICGHSNHVTNDCRFKGKPKCGIYTQFRHKDEEYWKNPANRGKERIIKARDKDPGQKEKKHINMAASGDSNSDTVEITKNIVHVNVATNNEADEADFSAYLWIADSGVTIHICNNQNAFEEYTILMKKAIQGISNISVTTYGQRTVLLDCQIDGMIS